jgi:hypothetical protein
MNKVGGSGGNTVSISQDRKNEDKKQEKGWLRRSLEFWTPFWIMVAGICAIIVALLTFVLVEEHNNTSAASKIYHSNAGHSSTPPAPPSPLTASQIAGDVTGDIVDAPRYSGATVTSATCYQDSVRQSGDGTAYAECDLTYSDGAVFRSAVTDEGGRASFQEQYQENLTTSDIADYVVGDVAASGIDTGATVTSATCYTAQLENNDWTYATCGLDLSNGAFIYATVMDNGIRNEFRY